MKKLLVVVGTRPNFIKVTRFREVASRYPDFELKIVHTGQHYDYKMADVFFQEFKLHPDFFLNVAQGEPEQQIALITEKLTALIGEYKPDMLLVVGDVNSTRAAAVAASNCGVAIGHVESGLRSFDSTMPEEHNRIVTDKLASIFFVTEPSGKRHLLAEGQPESKIVMTGNTMIDTLVAVQPLIAKSQILQSTGVREKKYLLMTIHRPSNVDTRDGLELVVELITRLSQRSTIVFPIHPRTRKSLDHYNLAARLDENKNVILIDPLGYFDFQKLITGASCVVTDSGGIQEETTFLGVPCLTLRPNTERPVTVDVGTNTLLPFNVDQIDAQVESVLAGKYKKGSIPDLWDGHATERIFAAIARYFE